MHTYTFIQMYTYIFIYIYIYIHIHTHTHLNKESLVFIYISTRMCICLHTYLYKCIYIYLYTYIYTYTHTHTPEQRESRFQEWAVWCYGVATISRLHKIIGLFAEYSLFYRALLQKRPIIFTPEQRESRLLEWVAQCWRRHCCTAPRPIYVTWLIHMCDMTHSFMWCGSFICVTAAPHRALYMWRCVCIYVWHDPLIYVM